MARTMARMWTRAAVALVVLVLGLVATVGVGARPASAHARLVGSDPGSGGASAISPARIVLRFDEPVEPLPTAIRLFDANGTMSEVGLISQRDGTSTVSAPVPTLANGTYLVAWKVVSADGHPVSGAYTFSVGDARGGLAPGVLAKATADSAAPSSVRAVAGVLRFLVYLAMAVAFGGLALAAFGWPQGRTQRRVTELLWIATGTAALASALLIGVQGSLLLARGLGSAVTLDAWRTTLRTHAGRWWLLRTLALGMPLCLLVALLRLAGQRWWRVTFAVVALAAAVATTFGGHGASGRWRAAAAVTDLAHLAAMAAWTGGLVVLAVAALARPGGDDDVPAEARAGQNVAAGTGDAAAPDVLRAMRWFSAMAPFAVGVLVASGVFQAVRQLGSWHALTKTDYGRLLGVKVIAVAWLVGLGAWSRQLLLGRMIGTRRAPGPRGASGRTTAVARAVGADVLDPQREGSADLVVATPHPTPPSRLRLRRAVAIEVAVALLVFGVTARLVAAPPGRNDLARTFDATVVQGERVASIQITPMEIGPNTLHVTLVSAGGSLDAADGITVRLISLSRTDIGPIDVPTSPLGPNHVTTPSLQIPFTGTWKLEAIATYGTTTVQFATTFVVA